MTFIEVFLLAMLNQDESIHQYHVNFALLLTEYHDGSSSGSEGSGTDSIMDTPDLLLKPLVSKSNSNETITSSTPTNSPHHKPAKYAAISAAASLIQI